MRRSAPVTVVLSLLASFALASPACSSNDPAVSDTDTGIEDVPAFEEPVFDSDDPAGRVLVLPLYFPDKRCLAPATEIGKFDEGPDGKIAECRKQEVCYERPDGVLAYHDQDCISAGNFRANWKRTDYSDLGPCEPLKHVRDMIKECPNASCTWARDLVFDANKGCATAITTKGCRETFGKPTKCWCDGAGSVFVPADPKSTATPPPSYSPCDATNADCKKALDVIDTVKGCVIVASDAGTDAKADGPTSDGATDASSDGG
ncbi:MAG: hypothetical protein HYV09_41490 [Deltaproteobacteria bacterium]|nr:hypothetical protein [Deltaproteobacteria bacterium]